jgi:hypothetical protein
MKYKIEVHSLGYEDTFKVVEASNSQKAKSGFNVHSAIIEWCEHNAIDIDNMEMPFVRISRIVNAQSVGLPELRSAIQSNTDK